MNIDYSRTPNGWITPIQLVDWAKASLDILKLDCDLTETEIRRVMRWIGDCSVDTIYIDGNKTRNGRIGIGNMLFVTLMVFPDYYIKYQLWQRN
jgi:hypothetical protein